MKSHLRHLQPLALVALAALLTGVPPAQASEPDRAVQKTFDKLLGAVKTADRKAFVAEGTAAVKEAITQEVMDTLKKDLGTRLEKGHKATYLCQLKQAGHQVYLWKVTFKDDGDDVVIRLALKNGKVGGFFLQ